jgi:hypothetical protein
MTGKAAGNIDPDTLELAPGTKHENLEGWAPVLGSDAEVLDALEKAFDYRGDVTLAQSWVRLFPKDSPEKRSIAYSEIAGLVFSGKDRAAGASWEAWVKKWNEKKAAGEKGFGLHPEALD